MPYCKPSDPAQKALSAKPFLCRKIPTRRALFFLQTLAIHCIADSTIIMHNFLRPREIGLKGSTVVPGRTRESQGNGFKGLLETLNGKNWKTWMYARGSITKSARMAKARSSDDRAFLLPTKNPK